MEKNQFHISDYCGWQKFNGGTVPDGYDVKLFPHSGLMIRKKITDESNEIINSIKNRILSEHKKYANKDDMDWALIAAKKIYGNFNIKKPIIELLIDYTLTAGEKEWLYGGSIINNTNNE